MTKNEQVVFLGLILLAIQSLAIAFEARHDEHTGLLAAKPRAGELHRPIAERAWRSPSVQLARLGDAGPSIDDRMNEQPLTTDNGAE